MFQKTYTTGLMVSGASWCSVIQNYDGGYTILSGYFYTYLVRTNSFGDTLWTKSYNIGFSNCFQKTTDGGYVILGGDGKIILYKTDSIGNILWSKNYGNTTGHLDNGYSVIQTTDRGYMIGASILQPGIGNRIYIVKTDSVGNIEWTKRLYYGTTFQGSKNVSIVQTNDGNYVVSSSMVITTHNSIVLMKFQSNGNLIWSKYYETLSSNYDEQFDLKQMTNGGFIIVGTTGFGSSNYNSLYLIKTDSIGNAIWSKAYGIYNSGFPYSVCATSDGGVILTGFDYYSSSEEDVFIMKTDNIGNLSWSKSYGAQGYNGGTCVKQTLDGGYVLTGYTEGVWPTPKGFFLIKTDSLGDSGCNENTPNDSIVGIPSIIVSSFAPVISSLDSVANISITIFPTDSIYVTPCPFTNVNENDQKPFAITISPNPFTSQTTITFSEEQKNTTIKVVNVLGEVVYQSTINGKQYTMDLSGVAKGIYFVSITSAGSASSPTGATDVVNRKIVIN